MTSCLINLVPVSRAAEAANNAFSSKRRKKSNRDEDMDYNREDESEDLDDGDEDFVVETKEPAASRVT